MSSSGSASVAVGVGEKLPFGESRCGGLREGESQYRAYEDIYARRYRHWRGESGRAYVFSIYSPAECPAYEDAVVIVAAKDRPVEMLDCVDLGAVPEVRLAALRRSYAGFDRPLEFHIHVLAERAGDRRALIADIMASSR